MNFIRQINIDSFTDAEQILSDIDLCNQLFDKAHVVGDVFYQNGKTYVWTEYQPHQYDWRIATKRTKILQGRGRNGKHGISLVKAEFAAINKDYNDTDKMLLQRTPNGKWRLMYNNQYIGSALDGDVVTQQELKADNIAYQGNQIVDNFDKVQDYMQFNSPDDVYFVQIIKRWKDNKDKPDAYSWKQQGKLQGTYGHGAEYLDYYLIHSYDELKALKPIITKSCVYNNARAYMSINSRSQKQVNSYISQFKARHGNNVNDPRVKFAEAILYGQAKTGPSWRSVRPHVLLDIDAVKDATVYIGGRSVNIWDETRRRLSVANIKTILEYETPSGGLHVILDNKNDSNLRQFYSGLKDFDGGYNLDRNATVHPAEDVKMVLYSNVDTEGY